MDASLFSPEMLVPTSENKIKQLIALGDKLQIIMIICMVANITLALLVTGKIVHRARTRRKSFDSKNELTNLPQYLLRKFCTNDEERLPKWIQWEIPTEDVFPLIFSIAISVQSSTFLYTETRDINGDTGMAKQCEKISELIWAAIWVIPMLTLVFALEFFARSFAPKGFSCRKKFTAITCVFISAVLTAITCIPLKVNDNLQGEPCTNLLLQPISQHGLSGLGLAGMLIPIWVFILVVIWLNLENNADTPVEERISAMKIGTHTLLVAFQVVLVIPYFATSVANSVNETSMIIAEVALNGLGLFCIFAQHFLDQYSQRLTDASQASGDPEKRPPHPNSSPGQPSGEGCHNFMNAQEDTTGEETTQITDSNCPAPKRAHTISELTSILGKFRRDKLGQAMLSIIMQAKHAITASSISSPKQLPQRSTPSTSASSSTPPPSSPTLSSTPPPSPCSSSPTSSSSSITSLLLNTPFIQHELTISPSQLVLPRPLPPLPVTYQAPPRPSRPGTPLNLDIAETLVRNVVIGRVPPRAGGRNSRSLTPIVEARTHKPLSSPVGASLKPDRRGGTSSG